jgi:glutathione S-transferase
MADDTFFNPMSRALDAWFSSHDYVCGERFAMAGVHVGSQVTWGLPFGSMPDRTSVRALSRPLRRAAGGAGSLGDRQALIAEIHPDGAKAEA